MFLSDHGTLEQTFFYYIFYPILSSILSRNIASRICIPCPIMEHANRIFLLREGPAAITNLMARCQTHNTERKQGKSGTVPYRTIPLN
jgi:hypothetical protein